MKEALRNTAILGLGSDLGDRMEHLENAISKLNSTGEISLRSSIYESEAFGFLSHHLFLNMVIELRTELSVTKLFQFCQEIESQQLRVKNLDSYEDRTMDIDILFFNNEILNNANLVVPHQGVCERAFVIAPLMEILPELIHPVEGKTIAELYLNCAGLKDLRLYHP